MLYELRHTFATRLSAGGVADQFVTQMLRQGDSEVFKRYSQAKLNMMREALWSGRQDLNLRPPAPKAGALPDCATPRLPAGFVHYRIGPACGRGDPATRAPADERRIGTPTKRSALKPLTEESRVFSTS